MPVRVLIADDHRPFCEALEAILGVDPRMRVVGSASNGLEAVDLAKRLRPDLVLMDISMPFLDGVEATHRIRSEVEGTCVLMLTGSDLPADVARAREAGASGYVVKDRIAAELIEAIVEVVAG
ncbi:MAG: response regulator transcription factor [Gaiellaceae bacterium]